MLKTKLTVRVEQDLLKNIKHYATKNNTTLTDLLDVWLRSIPDQSTSTDAPIVRRLSGTLSTKTSPEDYKKHIEEKYAR
jgi:hypothetical protein